MFEISSVVERTFQVFLLFLNYLPFKKDKAFYSKKTSFGPSVFFVRLIKDCGSGEEKDNDNGDNYCQNDNNDNTGPTRFESKRAHLDIRII